MRFTIHGFSQLELVKHKLSNDDALLLRWFIDFRDTGKMAAHIIDGLPFYWVKYESVIGDLPCIEIKNKESIARRFDKIVAAGILKKYIKKSNTGTYSLFSVDKNYEKLITWNDAPDLKVECKVDAPDLKVECAPDLKVDPKDPSIKDPSIKDPLFFEAPKNNIKIGKREKTPEQIEKAKKDYADRDRYIFHLQNKHGYIESISPDFNKMFFPVLKREGIDRIILTIDNYFNELKNADPGKRQFVGSIKSIFYQSVVFSKFANIKSRVSNFGEIDKKISDNKQKGIN
jgi:hypothetical protein